MIIIQWLLSPLFFGVAFLGPLISQVLLAMGWSGLDNGYWYVGMICGFLLGLTAQWRGSWLWIKP